MFSDYWLENRGGVPVLVFSGGGCRPATDTETRMWNRIMECERALEHYSGGSSEYFERFQRASWDKRDADTREASR